MAPVRPPLLALLCALTAALSTPAAHADSVNGTRISLPKGPGSIEGLASADFTPSLASGSSSYSVPIAVPPASAGFGPSLSLSYDSGAGLTEVGIGWRVAGAVKLRRRTEDGLPRFDDTDTFELVGLGIPCELLEVAPATFRPRYEDGSFVRVVRSENGGEWEVRTKSGVTLRLGGGKDYEESEGSHIAAWLLREQLDRHGHRIAYEWDTSEGHALLDRVVWNDFDEASRSDVAFDYEHRPDPHRGFSSGIREDVTRRLKSATVQHGGKLVRRLDLTYGSGEHPSLSAVTVVGNDGTSTLPAARFEYTAPTLVASPEQVVIMTNAPGRSPSSGDTALADMDGDGLPDFLVAQAGHYRTYKNHDGRRWLSADDWAPTDTPSASLGTVGVQLADLDADGAPDLVVKSGKDGFRYFPRPAGAHFDAPVTMATVPSFTFEDPDVRLADLDGDRRTDAIVTTSAGIAIGYNQGGTDFTEPSLLGVVDAAQPLRFSDGHTELCDVNGDRVQDFCYLHSSALTYWLGRGRGRFESALTATGVPEFDVSAPFRLDDLNGDGWVDLVRVDVNRVSYALATGEGVFGEVQTIEGTPAKTTTTSVQFADMNASGTVDIVWVDVTLADAPSWRYLELFPDGRAGLLRRIDNGLGKVQTIEYEPAALGAARARDAKKPWSTRMNVAMPVIRRVTVDSSVGDPQRVVEYAYRDGAYDAAERTFAAFGGGTERALGDASTPTLVTESAFDTGLVSRELRGAPLSRELRTDSGTVFTRSTTTYGSKALEKARDDRAVQYSAPASERVEHIEGSDTAQQTLTEFVEDDYGNVTEERRWGVIDRSDYLSGHDEALVRRTFANLTDDWVLGIPTSEELTDAAGARVSMTRKYYDGAPFIGLPLGQVTRGDVSREEAWVGPAADAFELVLGTKYNADGQPVETKDARGGGHVFDWAADHTAIRAEHVKLANGKELVETADVDGAFGALLAVSEYNGQQTHYVYDAFGRLTKVIRPGDTANLPTITYAYAVHAPLSRVLTEARIEAGEATVEHSETLFDGLGRSRGTLTKDGTRWVLAGVSFFDARGKPRRSLLPRWVDAGAHDAPPLLADSPNGTDTYRDAMGREVRTRSPSGIVARTEYLPLEKRHWDGGQNFVGATFEHTPTVERQDGLGRTIAHVQTLGGTELSALYTYDAAGNLITRTDPESARAAYTYDGRGRRTKVVDPDLGEHAFLFDATSNLVAHTYPDGKTERFTFDLAGRSLTEDHDGDGTPEVTRTWDTDPDDASNILARGKLVRVTGPSGETRHDYDERGRTTKTTLVIGGTTYAAGSEFDDQDRESRHVYPDGSTIALHRNARGQLSRYGNALSIDYGGDGLETERRFNTGVKMLTDYDADRRRSDLLVQSASGATLESLHWTYDSAGNLLEQQDRRIKSAPAKEDRSESYTYDNLYRLVGVTGAWGTESWSFSPSGSLLSRASSVKGQAIGSVTYGARPHAPVAFDGRKILYDARGRMKSDGERTYTWNDADQLVTVENGESSEENTYDGDGVRRIRVEHSAAGKDSTTHFIDTWSDVQDGKLVRYIVHGGQRIVRLAKDNGAPATAPPLFTREALHGQYITALVAFCTTLLGLLRVRRRKARVSAPFRAVAVAPPRSAQRLLGAVLCIVFGIFACNGNHGPAPGDTPPNRRAQTSGSVQGAVEELTDADTLLTTDLLGSLLGETTSSGKVTGRFASYPFGATRFDTSAEMRKYAGAPRDASVGLDAMGARFYAPDLGVWTSGDPLAVTAPEHLVTADFAAANPYAYAKDSPLISADRDGHFWHIAIGAAVGALMGGAMEAGRQYLATGKVEDWGRVGAAAASGGISGGILAANPLAGLAATIGKGAIAGAASGVTERLIASGGKSAGTAGEAIIDAGMGAATAGVLHAGGSLVKAAIRKAPSSARALSGKVAGAFEAGGECFAATTPVATPSGPRPIESLQVGDVVTTRDALTGETTVRPITRVFITPDKEVLELTFHAENGLVETITATPGHPFWVEGAGWTEARALALGARVQTAESGLATLSATQSRERRTTVYNLEVAGTHTYFVGETKAWVHNACGSGSNLDLRFSQNTASPAFSKKGSFAGKTIGGLAAELRTGTLAPSEVPVGYVTLEGNNLIVNTRSSLALRRAGIPESSWTLLDQTSEQAGAIQDRLSRNGLTNAGTETLRITRMESGVSNLE